MPVATISRLKKSRRQNSEEIEDARNTQASRPDDNVSDAEQPDIKVKREKKGKKRAVGGGGDMEDQIFDDDDDDDDDDRIDVDNFPDQPLNKADLHKLMGIKQDWETMATQIGRQSNIYKDVATAMTEAGEKDVNESKDLKALHADMKEFLDVCAEMQLHAEALNDLHQLIMTDDHVVDPQGIYEEKLQEKMDVYAGKTRRQKYLKDQRYIDFHASIWEVHHPNEPMPPLTDFIEREDGDNSDDEDDLEIGGVAQNYTCPISLTILVDPYTSKICKHSFSKESFEGYFRDKNRAYKCPASGCNKSFYQKDCFPDQDLAKKVKDYLRRVETQAAMGNEAEEVID